MPCDPLIPPQDMHPEETLELETNGCHEDIHGKLFMKA